MLAKSNEDLSYFDKSERHWIKMADIPHIFYRARKLLAVKDKIYLIGTFIVAEYNPRSKCWRKLPRFQAANGASDHRSFDNFLSVCATDRKLYVRSESETEVGPFQVLDLDDDDPHWKQIGRPNDEHPAGDYGLYPCEVVAVDGSFYLMGGGDTSVETMMLKMMYGLL